MYNIIVVYTKFKKRYFILDISSKSEFKFQFLPSSFSSLAEIKDFFNNTYSSFVITFNYSSVEDYLENLYHQFTIFESEVLPDE